MTARLIWRSRWQWIRCLTTRPVAEEPVGYRQIVIQDGTLKEQHRWVGPSDTQFRKYYQMLYKSTSWRDIHRILSHSPADAVFLEMTWNALKITPDGYSASRSVLEDLVQKTLAVIDELTDQGFASVWNAVARLSLLHPTLKEKLAQKALGESGDAAFLIRFSPRHLLNVLHSVARIHRLAKARNLLSPQGEAFPREMALLKVLLRESFKRLNEMNERDLSALALSMSMLGIVDGQKYRQLAEEAEKEIHLQRFTNWELANVAYALTQGGGLDLWRAVPRLVQEMLNTERHFVCPPRLLALFLRCLCETEHREQYASQILPMFQMLLDKDVLPLLHSTAIRSTLVGLGYFRIDDRSIWNAATTYLMQAEPSKFSVFDWTCILYSMGIVRYYHQEVLDKIATHLMQHPASLHSMRRMGLSNCFFAVGSLKYRNKTFVSALCAALLKEEAEPRNLTPPQITNILFSLAQIGFRHDLVVQHLVQKATESISEFTNHTLVLCLFGLSLDMYHGDISQLMDLVEEAFSDKRLEAYSNNELGMALCALGKLRPPIGHRFPMLLHELQKERRCQTYKVEDLVRIVKAFVDLRHPTPLKIKELLLQNLEKMEELRNRSFLDFLHCLESMEENEMANQLEARLRDALSEERLDGFRKEELSECMTALANLSMQLPSVSTTLVEDMLERIILQGALSNLAGTALYFSLSTMSFVRNIENRPLLYSLAIECSRPPRLKIYSEQQITGIFYNLALLKALHRTAFDAFVEEMMTAERLEKYKENHVVKILKGLSMGKHKNGLIVNALLNAFLHPDVKLESVTTASILLNLALLNCWKRPFVDILLQQISRETSLEHFGLWEIGVVTYVLGRKKHRNPEVIDLLCQQMTKERLTDASNMDLCNLVFGLAHLHHEDATVVSPLLSEVLKHARCESYSNSQLVRLLQSFAEWQIVDPCQFAGLSEQIRSDERCRSMRSLQLLMVLKALARLRLFQSDSVGHILRELSTSRTRLQDLTSYEIQELRFLAGMAKSSVKSECLNTILTAESSPTSGSATA